MPSPPSETSSVAKQDNFAHATSLAARESMYRGRDGNITEKNLLALGFPFDEEDEAKYDASEAAFDVADGWSYMGFSRREPIVSDKTKGVYISKLLAEKKETQQGRECVAKIVVLDPTNKLKQRRSQNEYHSMKRFDFPHIAKLYHSFVLKQGAKEHHVFLMEDCGDPVIEFQAAHGSPVKPSHLQEYVIQALKGLRFLHYHNLCHGDLKPDNMAVQKGNDQDVATHVLKLIDFDCVSSPLARVKAFRYGTPPFEAPEHCDFDGKKTDASEIAYSSDIWALGISIDFMLHGELLWERCTTKEDFEEMIKNGFSTQKFVQLAANAQGQLREPKRQTKVKEIAEKPIAAKLMQIIGECLHPIPGERPTSEQLLKVHFDISLSDDQMKAEEIRRDELLRSLKFLNKKITESEREVDEAVAQVSARQRDMEEAIARHRAATEDLVFTMNRYANLMGDPIDDTESSSSGSAVGAQVTSDPAASTPSTTDGGDLEGEVDH